jgi:Zn finger protein HypA/HybF involved in hydrogenase expression
MTDEPIEEQPYIGGVTVVDIGDLRVARGMTRRPFSSCRHASLNYDPKERRIWCKDCEKDVEAFDAFTALVEQYDRAYKHITKRIQEVDEAARFQCRLIATKTIEEAWRSRKMVPACPSCGNGLFPEDFKTRPTMLGRNFAMARRGKVK